MKTLLLEQIGNIQEGSTPLRLVDQPQPVPSADEVLVRVSVCGVCHTELDEIEGRTPPPKLPVVLGHQVVGRVAALGCNVSEFTLSDRVGVGWIFNACGECSYCLSDRENLCSSFEATGRDRNGGYAQYMVVPSKYVFSICSSATDAQVAPLLCAGAIGYRSLRLVDLSDGQLLGLTGFGSSAQLVLRMVRYLYPSSEVYVFARGQKERMLALELGAVWAGDIAERAPRPLHAIIDTTPAWKPLIEALENLAPGGRLVINAIRKEERDKKLLLALDYSRHIWLEKEIKSVANVCRRDIREFLALAATSSLIPQIHEYPLAAANEALVDLKYRPVTAAKVLVMPS